MTGVDPNAFDAAGDGWTIYQKYIMGENPNTFVTPPAPSGLTAAYDASTETATVTWLPSPGHVTGYVLMTPSGPVTLPATATSYTDSDPNLPVYLNPSVFDYAYYTHYDLEASYAGGDSAPANANLMPTVSAVRLVQGAQGASYLAIAPAALPPGTAAIRFARLDVWAEEFYQDHSFDVSNDIPLSAFTNGLYQLPLAWTTDAPPMDSYGEATYDWTAQTVNAAGGANSQAVPVAMADNVWPLPPDYDGRVQLQQNLIFQLRAASESQPFQFADYEANDVYPLGSSGASGLYYWDTNTRQEEDSTEASLFTAPANCGYASLWVPDAGATWTDANGLTHALLTLDAFAPFAMNARYRNFVFDPAALDASGLLATASADAGILPYYGYYSFNGYPLELYDPVYALDPANFDPTVSLLATNQTRWLFAQWENNSAVYGDGSDTSITTVGANYVMAGDARNWFGLPYRSAAIAAGDASGVTLATLNAGDSLPADGYLYPEVAQPQLQTVEYDFWNAGGYYDLNGNYFPWATLPGMDNFSPTNQTDNALIVGLNSSIQVAGYAKEAVLNGYSGVYGYLGQYFDQAYAMDTNGNVTTNQTGVLSPYGNFFATQPGPAALVTMPDLDTGARGTAVVNVVSLALDKNHDGTMDLSFSGPDATSQASPMIFWCNDNFDRWNNDGIFNTPEQDDLQIAYNPGTSVLEPDCNYTNEFGQRAISCTRDLEDFTRLWVNGVTTNLLAALPTNSTITLSWGDVGNPNPNNPTIDLFTAADADGGIGYLTNETVAANQIEPTYSTYAGRIAPGQSLQLNADTLFQSLPYNWLGNHYIWCGVSNGVGSLTLTIADGNGNVLAQASQWIQIVDIKQLYERWTVGDDSDQPPTATASLLAEGLPAGTPTFQYTPPNTNTTYILHVHGYNMKPWEKDRFAETEFKRLYWQGYQGRFGAFDWPTAESAVRFGGSELQAWKSAPGLLNLLTELNAEYPGQVYLTVHSLGNVVAGEALRLATNQVVNTYIAMQGAVSAHAYDPNTTSYTLTEDWGAPDCYAHYWTSNAPCYFNGSIGAGTYVNFFNTNDWALSKAWLFFQNSKPILGLNYSFTPPDFYYKNSGSTELFFPTNTYELFDDIIQSRSYALGMQPDVGGVFISLGTTNQVLLPSIWPPDAGEYKAHIWHSAEFRSDSAQRWQFWDEVLIKMGLK